MVPPADNLDPARPAGQGGFTLPEVALTLVIVGVGILGVVRLLAACTQQNRAAADATTAMFLANNVQEAMADLPFSDPSGSDTFGLEEGGQPLDAWDDIDDFNGYTAFPPMDGTRQTLAGMNRFSQRITVQRVDPQKLSLNAAGTDAARVTVRVFRHKSDGTVAELSRLTWVRVRT